MKNLTKLTLTAAAIGLAACSVSDDLSNPTVNGKDGVDGVNGTSCYTTPLSDSTGYKIVCGEDSVGVLLNGKSVSPEDLCTITDLPEDSDVSGVLVTCGGTSAVISNGAKGDKGDSGDSCSVVRVNATDSTNAGLKVTCGDQSQTIYDGQNGKNGEACTSTVVYDINNKPIGADITCAGETTRILNGEKGEKGNPGEYCTTSVAYGTDEFGDEDKSNPIGVALKCGDTSPMIIYNGEKGDRGSKGPAGDNCTSAPYVVDGDTLGVSVTCGESVQNILNGEKGDKGETGEAGESCIVRDTINTTEEGETHKGAIIKCSESTTVLWDVAYVEYLESKKYFIDERDGKKYRMVTIGTQTWMAENLNHIPELEPDWSYCIGETDDDGNCATGGRYYRWANALGLSNSSCGYNHECSFTTPIQGVCPDGWHVPTTAEWNTLVTVVGGTSAAAAALKATSGWGNYNGTDVYGFSAEPYGYVSYSTTTTASNADSTAEFYVASQYSSSYGYYVSIGSSSISTTNTSDKDHSRPIRCVKD